MAKTLNNAARAQFPAGLRQPAGAARFGADALLLAANAARAVAMLSARQTGNPLLAAELGSGCGAASLGFALLEQRAQCLGLELAEAATAAARQNARLLALVERVQFAQCDVRLLAAPDAGKVAPLADWIGKTRIVLANPPWRRPGQGRPPKTALRQLALHGGHAGFCAAASRLLAQRGFFCLISDARIFTHICASLAQNRLGLREVLPIASHRREHAKRLLLLARKDCAPEPVFAPPLVLHEADGSITAQARAFCPWLARQGNYIFS